MAPRSPRVRSFGALAVNDVVGAAMSVAFYMWVSTQFYAVRVPGFSLWMLQWFKLGFFYGLIMDSFKLGGAD